jgi:hypothetical protein
MPFFDYTQYNYTSSPNPTTKNSITSTAKDFGFRDFLLLKNLSPRYPQAFNLSPGTVRIGEPVLDTSINNNANVTPFGLPLEVEGLFRYDIAILPNRFKNENPNAPQVFDIEYIQQTQGMFGPIDFPQGTQSYPTSATQEVKDLGLFGKTEYANFRKNNTLYNLYLDESKQLDVSDYLSLQPIVATTQLTGYLDEYGDLNVGDTKRARIADIIGSVLNGQGVGISRSGIVSNFDVRASLAGRVLGATGVINDTKLGNIGAQQLAFSLANNAAFNLQQDLLGVFNVKDNILEVVRGDADVSFRPNYQITVSNNALGKAADYSARLLGFTLPKSYLNEAGSIFLSESNSANIERTNSMILNTGRGQVKALMNNVNANIIGTTDYDNPNTTAFRSGYVPGYKDNKGREAINPNLYAFYNSDKATIYNFVVTNPTNVIPEINYNREKMVSEYGFKSPEEQPFIGHRGEDNYDNRTVNTVGFSWGSFNSPDGSVNENADYSPLVGDKKSLLVKTQKLFNSKGMKNIVTAKGDVGHSSSQISSANNGAISKGSAVLAGNLYSSGVLNSSAAPENMFCRSWTTINRYDTVNNLIRHEGLKQDYPYRNKLNGSVLDDNGFVKVTPYSTDKKEDLKKFMFSIENLAWSDDLSNLPPCEQGSGDLLTGTKGRIMWFPPYNIQFNETSSVDWEATKFIGRGEPLYTYNNTERSGTLSFSIIVDHPSYVNQFKNTNVDDNFVASYFAGCVDKLSVGEINDIQVKTYMVPQQKVVTKEVEPPNFEIFFPNDEDNVNDILSTGYENGLMNNSPTPTNEIDYSVYQKGDGFGIGAYAGNFTSGTAWPDGTNFGLNGWKNKIQLDGSSYNGWIDSNYITALNDYLIEKCPNCVITITSFASKQGNKDINKKLADARTNSIYDYLYPKLFVGKDDVYKRKRILKSTNNKEIDSVGCNPQSGSKTDTKGCKEARKSSITFRFDANLIDNAVLQPSPVVNQPNDVTNEIKNRFYTECDYFDKLVTTNKFVFDKFRDKIKYFHPSFHSMTPEGLNSRLNFLHQCTRQGPTNEAKGATNLAFGRAPVCILRIGDFYNTKVVFDSLTIDYEPLVWDINPEGVGVQPMIANVNLSFKFLGGSSLLGPINRLQNALSFNYYANTQVYDPRADYIATKSDLDELLKNKNIEETEAINKNLTLSIDGEYGIVGGIKNMGTQIEKPNLNTSSKPQVNQVIANNINNGPSTLQPAGQQPPVSPNTNSGSDYDRIDFNFVSLTYEPNKEMLTSQFIIKGGSLTSNKTFRLYLTDNNTVTYELGVGEIDAQNNNTQVFSFELPNNLEDGHDYFILAKFKEGTKPQNFTYIKI